LKEATVIGCYLTAYDSDGDTLIVDTFDTNPLDPGQSGRVEDFFFEKMEYDLPIASVEVQCFA
jgi:hypothetical protein